MKKYWIYLYIIVIFIVITLIVPITGKLATEYLLPTLDSMLIVSKNASDYFYWVFAFSFLLFSVLVTPAVIFYKFKNNLLSNIFLTILISSILWILVNVFMYSFTPHENKNAIALYSLYTLVSIIIGILTVFIVFFISYLKRQAYE